MRWNRFWTFILLVSVTGTTPAVADVASLVSQVSQANLMAHVMALEGDRYTVAGQAAAVAYITAELESYGHEVSSQPISSSENVIVEIPGQTRPDEVFVLGAHFDSRSGTPGADDNASGVAVALETARILADQPLDWTVMIVFFAFEEYGMGGSEGFAAALKAANVDVVGMISLDMVGYTCDVPGCQALLPDIPDCVDSMLTSTVGDFIGLGANTASVGVANAFHANTAVYVPELPIESFTIEGNGTCFPDSRRSDHKSFWDEGYPAIILGDGAEARNPNYHQATDTIATLDFDFMAAVNRAVVAHLASANAVSPVPLLSLPGSALLVLGLLRIGLRARRRQE